MCVCVCVCCVYIYICIYKGVFEKLLRGGRAKAVCEGGYT